MGCNAGGAGLACRFCGFGGFPACPGQQTMDVAIAVHVAPYCPTLCGPTSADTCTLDTACGDGLGAADGCNAGGRGAQCRWCAVDGASSGAPQRAGNATATATAGTTGTGPVGLALAAAAVRPPCPSVEARVGQLVRANTAGLLPDRSGALSAKVQLGSGVSTVTSFDLAVHDATDAMRSVLQQAAQRTLCEAAGMDESSCSVEIEGGVLSAAPEKCAIFDGPRLETELHAAGADLRAMDAADDGECCAACEADSACTGFVRYAGWCYLKTGALTPVALAHRTAYLRGSAAASASAVLSSSAPSAGRRRRVQSTCTPLPAPTCAGPTEICFADPTCLTVGGLGCGAGGSAGCRFCGFSLFSPCPPKKRPSTAPPPANAPVASPSLPPRTASAPAPPQLPAPPSPSVHRFRLERTNWPRTAMMHADMLLASPGALGQHICATSVLSQLGLGTSDRDGVWCEGVAGSVNTSLSVGFNMVRDVGGGWALGATARAEQQCESYNDAAQSVWTSVSEGLGLRPAAATQGAGQGAASQPSAGGPVMGGPQMWASAEVAYHWDRVGATAAGDRSASATLSSAAERIPCEIAKEGVPPPPSPPPPLVPRENIVLKEATEEDLRQVGSAASEERQRLEGETAALSTEVQMQTFGLVSMALGALLLCLCAGCSLWVYRRRQRALAVEHVELKRIELQKSREMQKHRQLQFMIERLRQAPPAAVADDDDDDDDDTDDDGGGREGRATGRAAGGADSGDRGATALPSLPLRRERRSRMSLDIPRSAAVREGPPSSRQRQSGARTARAALASHATAATPRTSDGEPPVFLAMASSASDAADAEVRTTEGEPPVYLALATPGGGADAGAYSDEDADGDADADPPIYLTLPPSHSDEDGDADDDADPPIYLTLPPSREAEGRDGAAQTAGPPETAPATTAAASAPSEQARQPRQPIGGGGRPTASEDNNERVTTYHLRTSATDHAVASLPVIAWSKLKLDGLIASSAVGKIYSTNYRDITAAVRRLDTSVRSLYSDLALKLEVDQLAAMRHPHLLRTVALVTEGPHSAGVLMQLAPSSLQAVLSQQGTSPLLQAIPKLAVSIAHQTAQGLAYLHDHGVWHGSLWPPNVMLGGKSGSDVKLADYGRSKRLVCHLLEAEEKSTSSAVGAKALTPASDARRAPFAAPELLHDHVYAAPGDVYALGCLLARMGSAAPLFAHELQTTPWPKLFHSLCVGEVSPTLHLHDHPDLPLPIVELAERCVTLEAKRRPKALYLARSLEKQLSFLRAEETDSRDSQPAAALSAGASFAPVSTPPFAPPTHRVGPAALPPPSLSAALGAGGKRQPPAAAAVPASGAERRGSLETLGGVSRPTDEPEETPLAPKAAARRGQSTWSALTKPTQRRGSLMSFLPGVAPVESADDTLAEKSMSPDRKAPAGGLKRQVSRLGGTLQPGGGLSEGSMPALARKPTQGSKLQRGDSSLTARSLADSLPGSTRAERSAPNTQRELSRTGTKTQRSVAAPPVRGGPAPPLAEADEEVTHNTVMRVRI